MEYEIVELKEKIVEGVEIITTNQNGKSLQDIAEMWQKFFTEGIYNKIENNILDNCMSYYK